MIGLAYQSMCNSAPNGNVWYCINKTCENPLLLYHKTSLTCSCPPGQSRFPRPRRYKPQHVGADLAHVRGGPTADLHADAEGLVPAFHQLGRVHGSAKGPGGASSRAIRLTHASPLPKKGTCVPPEGRTCLFQLEFRINTSKLVADQL